MGNMTTFQQIQLGHMFSNNFHVHYMP